MQGLLRAWAMVLNQVQNALQEWAILLTGVGGWHPETWFRSPGLRHCFCRDALLTRCLLAVCSTPTTKCGHKGKVLQHHIEVEEPLRLIKEFPFLPGEVDKHISKGHTALASLMT